MGRTSVPRKTSAESAGRVLVPQPHGGALRVGGAPGNKGGPGRPPDAFKARMAALADRAARALEVARILDDPEHPLYLDAAKWAADRGYGKPEATQTVKGDADAPLVIRVVDE